MPIHAHISPYVLLGNQKRKIHVFLCFIISKPLVLPHSTAGNAAAYYWVEEGVTGRHWENAHQVEHSTAPILTSPHAFYLGHPWCRDLSLSRKLPLGLGFGFREPPCLQAPQTRAEKGVSRRAHCCINIAPSTTSRSWWLMVPGTSVSIPSLH